MDAKSPSEPLKYQTWFLKVSIHCEGCRKKVKKVLKSIDGVFTTTIDPNQHKVTVTGNVAVETLLKRLFKAGKHAEIWPENLNEGKKKISGDSKKNKNNEPRETPTEKAAAKCENKNKSKNSNSKNTTAGDLPEKSPAGDSPDKSSDGYIPEKTLAGEVGNGGSGKKKKKKDGGGENEKSGVSLASNGAPAAHSGFEFQNQVNLNPTRQQTFSYPQTEYHPMIYAAAYNRFYPMGNSYYVPPTPYYMYGTYQFQSAPLVPFEIFSDENANGCFIM